MALSVSGQSQSVHAEGKEYAPVDPLIHRKDTTWGEQWAATMSKTIDEETSISPYLNMGGWKDRDLRVQEMVEDGYDLSAYKRRDGTWDYDSIAKDFQGTGVATDGELWKARTEELADRRAYEEELDGPGTARFVGAMHGAMMDPINMGATVLAAPAAVMARTTSVLGAAARGFAVEGLINGAVEIPIQSVVNSYKQDIESPYSDNDVLMAIGGAVLLGGGVGAVTNGLGHAVRTAVAKRNSTYGGIIDEWRTNADVMEEMGADAADVKALRRAADQLAENPNRPKVMEMRDTLRSYLTMSTDDVLRAADEFDEGSWQRQMATEIEARRAKAASSVPEKKSFEVQELEDVLIKQGVDPQRAVELAERITRQSITPEYRARLEARLEKVEAKLSKAGGTNKHMPARVRKKLAADNQKKTKGLEAERTDLERRLKADDEAIAARRELEQENIIVDEAATERARAAEEDRVRRINEAEEQRWNEFMTSAMLKADIDYLRTQQAEFNKLEAKRGDAPTEEARKVERTNVDEINTAEVESMKRTLREEGGPEIEQLEQLEALRACRYG